MFVVIDLEVKIIMRFHTILITFIGPTVLTHQHKNHAIGHNNTFSTHSVSTKKNLQQGVYHVVALLFTLKSILRQAKNYGKFKTFHHAKI